MPVLPYLWVTFILPKNVLLPIARFIVYQHAAYRASFQQVPVLSHASFASRVACLLSFQPDLPSHCHWSCKAYFVLLIFSATLAYFPEGSSCDMIVLCRWPIISSSVSHFHWWNILQVLLIQNHKADSGVSKNPSYACGPMVILTRLQYFQW